MNKNRTKKVAATSLAAMMIFGMAGSLSIVQAQNVREGQTIKVNNSVGTLEAIVNAGANDYFENDKMRITKLQNDVYQIDEETTAHPADGPTNNPSSIYLVVGEKSAAMIDGGNGVYNRNFDESFIKDVIDQLVGDKELKVLITHSHGDHIGVLRDYGNEVLSKDVPVYIHEDDIESLSQKVKDNFTVHGLKDGDEIEAGGRKLTVLSEYGHTDGSVVYVDESDEIIFSGDTIGSGSVWLADDEDLGEFDQSINKLASVVNKMNNPVFYAGHRWQQSNGAAHANEKTAVNEMGKQYVLEMDALLDDIVDDRYSKTDPYAPYAGHIGVYSEKSDLNKDGIIPGVVTTEKSIGLLQEQQTAKKAINSIIIPRYEKDGSKTQQHISDTLKSHLKVDNIKQTKEENAKTITVDVQLKDVNLTSDYKNCVGEPGTSYYNMLSYYVNVLQVKEVLDQNPGYSIIDSQGNKLDEAYVNELVGLLKQINDFDPTTNLVYDLDSAYDTEAFKNDPARGGTDVIATSKEGHVTMKFHIDAHGWWGYDLGMHDSITGVVMGYDADYAYENQSDLTKQYGNFFVIKMKEDQAGTWYMLDGTDLENPMIYVSKDKKEAFMIDVDFYGENVIVDKIKSVIGDQCESLKIFLTHNHGDHVNNLDIIGQDDHLRNITTIVWPENEPHTKKNGKDLISDIAWKNIQTLKDSEKFTAAGVNFQFIEIPNEHTPGGGQLADLTHKVIYSGDSLGAQIQYGGTNFTMSNAQNWLLGAQKAEKYIKDNGIQYNIGGHTPYLNNPAYASWVATSIKEAYDKLYSDPSWAGGTIVVENGKVVSAQRAAELQGQGLTDREVLNVCSVTFRNNLTKEYDVTEGKDAIWKKESEDKIKMSVKAEDNQVTTILVDSDVVDTDCYEIADDGKTIVFKDSYLNSLAIGSHKVLLQLSDGVALTTLEVHPADKKEDVDKPSTGDTDKPTIPDTEKPGKSDTKEPTIKADPVEDTKKETKKDSSTVKTGDDAQLWGLVTSMVLAGGTICMIKRKKKDA